ncbi:uncharacterized protein VSU04_015479 [Chlamydotis macqueenii]
MAGGTGRVGSAAALPAPVPWLPAKGRKQQAKPQEPSCDGETSRAGDAVAAGWRSGGTGTLAAGLWVPGGSQTPGFSPCPAVAQPSSLSRQRALRRGEVVPGLQHRHLLHREIHEDVTLLGQLPGAGAGAGGARGGHPPPARPPQHHAAPRPLRQQSRDGARPGAVNGARGGPRGGQGLTPPLPFRSIGVITYILRGEMDAETLSSVVASAYEFEERCFSQTSEMAKDFIQQLLMKEPAHRITAAECLVHPWIKPLSQKQVANRSHSSINMKNFRKFNARRKWKLSYNMVSACNRLCRRWLLCSMGCREEGLGGSWTPKWCVWGEAVQWLCNKGCPHLGCLLSWGVLSPGECPVHESGGSCPHASPPLCPQRHCESDQEEEEEEDDRPVALLQRWRNSCS